MGHDRPWKLKPRLRILRLPNSEKVLPTWIYSSQDLVYPPRLQRLLTYLLEPLKHRTAFQAQSQVQRPPHGRIRNFRPVPIQADRPEHLESAGRVEPDLERAEGNANAHDRRKAFQANALDH